MLHLGPGTEGKKPEAPDPEEDAPHVPGMESTTPEAAAAALERTAARKAREADPDATGVSDERLKELKEKARAQVEARIASRRKQRRLLRGGDLPRARRS